MNAKILAAKKVEKLMDEHPGNLWHNNELLIGGLAYLHHSLGNYLLNVADVHEGTAKPVSAKAVAALGVSMAEAGAALTGRIVNALPQDIAAPKFT